ncbi:MAG: hypothetical protein QOI66_3224, partial [Myxococcales bacterium]|nr:hypothetical protein [Myxococcales bacterium]
MVAVLAGTLASACSQAPSAASPPVDGGGDGPSTTAETNAPDNPGANDDASPATMDALGGDDEAAPTQPETGSGKDADNTGADGPGDRPLMGLVKILVLGSSNETDTCWRAFLWQKLRAAGVTNFDFVGRTKTGPDCGVPGYDKDVEAESGTIITGFTANDFAVRFKANPPQIVLVHVGGADARNGVPIPKILSAYSLAVEQARAVNPQVIFFVAQHTPQVPPTGISELNAAIPGWAAQISTAGSPVAAVDLFTGIVP